MFNVVDVWVVYYLNMCKLSFCQSNTFTHCPNEIKWKEFICEKSFKKSSTFILNAYLPHT